MYCDACNEEFDPEFIVEYERDGEIATEVYKTCCPHCLTIIIADSWLIYYPPQKRYA
jgi:hypothetical protein